jgi:hypothetical protein
MTRTTDQGWDEDPPVLSPALADILRPELASLADEIIAQLREKIPLTGHTARSCARA